MTGALNGILSDANLAGNSVCGIDFFCQSPILGLCQLRVLITSLSSVLLLLQVIHQPDHITQRIGTKVSPSDLIAADKDDNVIPGIEVPNDHIERNVMLGTDFVSVVSVDD
ncbi:MAG: hypothetical protein E7321_01820 [Clostridiales bacterium]|nr:hypothetical protein [Clostridiales bacterium]